MPDPTPRLGLPKPEVNDEAWDDDYYLAMDILDRNPGISAWTSLTKPETPFDGQVVLETDTGRLVAYSEVFNEWRAAVGAPEPAAHNIHDEATNVSPGATEVVATAVAPSTYRFTGFSATGTGDGYFTVVIDGTKVLSDRIDNINRSCRNISPRGIKVPTGGTVQLFVHNEARGSRQYEGTIFGEVNDG